MQKQTKDKNKVVSIDNTEHFVWGNRCDGWWLKKSNGFTVIEETMPPGSLEEKHFHRITEQFFYVLEGTLCIEINNEEYQLQNNQGMAIPAKSIHQVFNKSKDPARFLVISCPDSHEDRVNLKDAKSDVIY